MGMGEAETCNSDTQSATRRKEERFRWREVKLICDGNKER